MTVFDPSPAEEGASPAATDRDSLRLTVLRDGVHTRGGLTVDASTVTGRIRRSVDAASELTLQLHDPDWLILGSGLFETDLTGAFLQPIEVQIGPLWFRLVKVVPAAEQLTLTFEDREISLLREQTYKIVADRGNTTLAEFAERLIRATKDDLGRLRAWIPELHERQAIAGAITGAATSSTAQRAAGDARRERGLPARMTVRQWDGGKVTLNSTQTANAETVLAAAKAVGAGPKATLALVEACIVEPAGYHGSGPFDNPAGGDASSVGILQLLNLHLGGSTSTKGGRRDIDKVCRLFLTKGFTSGVGAIGLAKAHPDWTAGQVAQACQGSGHGDRYDQVADSAGAIIAAWSGGGGRPDTSNDPKSVKPYLYRVTGDYWKTLTTYAEAVNWRCFVNNGVIYFASEERLFESRARATLTRKDVNDLTFDWDVRKTVAEVSFTCRADFWSAPPGSVVELKDAGPASGRYLVKSTERGLVDPTTTVTLSKPILKQAEEADPAVAAAGATSPASSSSSSARDGGFPAGSHLAKAYAEMRAIDKRDKGYLWGGGHAGFDGGPYDCSGAVSAVLHAAGLLSTPQSTSGLISWGQPGEGQHLTTWVKEIPGSPNTSHTFMTIKTPDGKTVYFEAGGNDSSHTGFHSPRSHQDFQPRHWPGL